MATCFTPIICRHTGTIEPLTQQEMEHEAAQLAFRARILAVQRVAREKLARATSTRKRLFAQQRLLRQAPPPSVPQRRRRPGRRKKKQAAFRSMG